MGICRFATTSIPTTLIKSSQVFCFKTIPLRARQKLGWNDCGKKELNSQFGVPLAYNVTLQLRNSGLL